MSRFGELLRKGWRGAQNQARIVLAGAALFLLAFLLGIHLFFPTAAVQRWLGGEVAARTPVTVQLAKMSLRPFSPSAAMTAPLPLTIAAASCRSR